MISYLYIHPYDFREPHSHGDTNKIQQLPCNSLRPLLVHICIYMMIPQLKCEIQYPQNLQTKLETVIDLIMNITLLGTVLMLGYQQKCNFASLV